MRQISPSLDDQKPGAIRRRLIETWLKTAVGYLGMGALILGAFKLFGSSYHIQLGFGLLWILLPAVMWWFSAKVALMMSKAVPADPNNPEHKRLIDILDPGPKTIDALMRLDLPSGVDIEIKL